jgi:hypothetical protein
MFGTIDKSKGYLFSTHHLSQAVRSTTAKKS